MSIKHSYTYEVKVKQPTFIVITIFRDGEIAFYEPVTLGRFNVVKGIFYAIFASNDCIMKALLDEAHKQSKKYIETMMEGEA